MYKFGNVLIRQAWRNARACVNKSLIVNTPLLSARALETCRLDGRVCGSQGNKSRFLSTSVEQEEEDLEGDLHPFSLIGDETKDVYNEIVEILRKNIRNTDMYNIAMNYFHTRGDSTGVTASILILLCKTLNHHLFNDATLTDTQIKAIAIVEVMLVHSVLHDDILDSADIRQGLAPAHQQWSLNQVIVTGNMVLGVAFGEASKLSNDISISVCQAHEVLQKGQYMHFKEAIDGDLWGHYLTAHDCKSGSILSYITTATAQAVGARKSVVDIIAKLGYNMGMLCGVVDDIADFEEDLRNGRNSATAIFATREYPELKEMILRRFSEEGDVEKTIELVNKSQGFEEARTLARMYHRFTMSDLRLLADSPYRRALEALTKLILLRIEPGEGVNFLVDV